MAYVDLNELAWIFFEVEFSSYVFFVIWHFDEGKGDDEDGEGNDIGRGHGPLFMDESNVMNCFGTGENGGDDAMHV
jgi:hypothetical protein